LAKIEQQLLPAAAGIWLISELQQSERKPHFKSASLNLSANDIFHI